MGLDLVVFFMAVEDSFGIHISDEDASRAFTVGDLHALVMRNLAEGTGEVCRTGTAFRRLRREFALGSPECLRARPSTPLPHLIPAGEERRTWVRISRSHGWTLPDLWIPGWASTLIVSVSAVGAIVTSIAVHRISPDPLDAIGSALGAGSLAFIGLLLLASWLARPLERALPVATLGDLARRTAALNFSGIDGGRSSWREAEIWPALRTLVSDKLGVPESKVTPQAHFIRDLRAS